MTLRLRSRLAPALALLLALAPLLMPAPGAHAQAPVPAPVPASDPIQQQFVEAMQAVEAGRPDEAATILAILAARTDAPRIRLELARALYFTGRLKEARREFLKVYVRGDLPYAVRRTVNTFLADIDQRAGYLEPRLSLAYDSNPQLSAPSGVYEIFGIPLEYESTARPEAGLRLEASGAIPLGRTGISAIGAAGVTGYADPDLGQLFANGGLRRLDGNRRGWIGGAVSYFERQGQDAVITTYVEKVKRLTLPDQSRQLLVRAALNHTSVRNQDHLDGWGLEGGVDYGFDLSPNVAVNVSGAAGSAGAKYDIDRRLYGNVAAGLTVAVPRWNKTVSLRASVAENRYGGVDPFFGRRREDRSYGAEARLVDGRPLYGLFPSVSLTWDQRSSSVGFFDYQQAGFAVGLQRRF